VNKALRHVGKSSLIVVLSGAMIALAEPLPQDPQSPKVLDDQKTQPAPANPDNIHIANASNSGELPDAPTPAQPVQQSQQDTSQQQTPNPVPSGTAGAKAPTVKGAPASRPIGAAIAPTKQKQRRSLLIKTGLVAGAAIAVGSVFALTRSSPAKPPGAP
jgi:hypothetical protein